MNTIGIDHVYDTIWGGCFQQSESNHTSVHDLLFLGCMIHGIRQKGFEEGSKINRVPSNNEVVLLSFVRKAKLAKLGHSFQTVRVEGLIARVEARIHIVCKNILKVAHFG